MPAKIPVYVCPFCDEEFPSEEEAEDCRDSHDAPDIEKRYVWQCEFCDSDFETQEGCREHELTCKSAPDSCSTCAHCEPDGRKYLPCPDRGNFRTIYGCEQFERAKIVQEVANA